MGFISGTKIMDSEMTGPPPPRQAPHSSGTVQASHIQAATWPHGCVYFEQRRPKWPLSPKIEQYIVEPLQISNTSIALSCSEDDTTKQISAFPQRQLSLFQGGLCHHRPLARWALRTTLRCRAKPSNVSVKSLMASVKYRPLTSKEIRPQAPM